MNVLCVVGLCDFYMCVYTCVLVCVCLDAILHTPLSCSRTGLLYTCSTGEEGSTGRSSTFCWGTQPWHTLERDHGTPPGHEIGQKLQNSPNEKLVTDSTSGYSTIGLHRIRSELCQR